MASMAGGCLCGRVRFEVTASFQFVTHCHCTSCKHISGGTGTVNGRVRSDAVRVVAGEDALRRYQPGEGSAKTFCRDCGSNLFGGGWPESERASVRLTALDRPLRRKVDRHIFVRSVAPWETLPGDGAERFDAQAPE
jgi:hypothetical protein